VFANRHLATFVALFTAGIAFGVYFSEHKLIIAIISAGIASIYICLACLFLFVNKKTLFVVFFKIPLYILIGICYIIIFTSINKISPEIIPDESIYISGTVEEIRFSEYYNTTNARIKVISSEGNIIPEGTIISAFIDERMFENISTEYPDKYDIIDLYATLNSNVSVRSLANGIDLYADIEPISVIKKDSSGINNILDAFRNKTADYFDSISFWDKDISGLAKAVIINYSSDMNLKITNDFRRSGIVHFLAISGFHLTIITGGFLTLLRFLKVNIRIRYLLCLPFTILYAALIGFTPSITRALIMLAITLIARVITDKSDSYTSLFFALLVILFINPYSITDIGLQLSFLSVIGIITAMHYMKKLIIKSKNNTQAVIKKYLLLPVSISIFAFLFTLPVVSLIFNEIPAISPIFNLIFSPILSIILILLFISAVLGLIFPPLGVPFAYIAGKGLSLMFKITSYINSKSIFTISNTQNLIIPLIMLLAVLIAFLLAKNIKIRRYTLYTLAVALAVFFVCVIINNDYNSKISKLTVFNTYYSNHLIISSNGNLIFFDFSSNYIDYNELSDNGYLDFELCFFTDYSDDTVRNINLMSSRNIVKTVYLPFPDAEDNKYIEELYKISESNHFNIEFYSNTESFLLGKNKVKIFSSDDSTKGFAILADLNKNSAMFIGPLRESPSEYLSFQYCDALLFSDRFFEKPNFPVLPDLNDITYICAFNSTTFINGLNKAYQKSNINVRTPNYISADNAYTIMIDKNGHISFID